jgi:hypothetical protein
VRGAFVLSAVIVVVVVGCGGGGARPQAPAGNASAEPVVVGPPVAFTISETRWLLDVPGARHTRGDYTERFVTSAWTIEVSELPPSDIFAQTLADDLALTAKYHPGHEVLFQRDDGERGWASVTLIDGKIFGAHKITGPINVLCTFQLAEGDDWRPALAACGKIHPAPVDPAPAPGY